MTKETKGLNKNGYKVIRMTNPTNYSTGNYLKNNAFYMTAIKATITALKTIEQKTATREIRQLLNDCYGISNNTIKDNNTYTETMDLINVAVTTLYDIYNKSTLSINSFIELELYNEIVIDGIVIVPMRNIYKAINTYIYSQKSTKGRKTTSVKTIRNISDCITYDNMGNVLNTTSYKPETITNNGYKIELISLESHLTSPTNYDKLSYEYELSSDIEYAENEATMLNMLSPNEKIIFSLLQEGLTQVEICVKLEKSKTTINTQVMRIRTKIANSGLYSNYEAVKKYATN